MTPNAHPASARDDPFKVPTLPELEDILRKSLPANVVFAIAPTGDPFVRWARYMLEGYGYTTKAHKPGEHHDYSLTCKVCGQPGLIRVSIDPERANPDPEAPR